MTRASMSSHRTTSRSMTLSWTRRSGSTLCLRSTRRLACRRSTLSSRPRGPSILTSSTTLIAPSGHQRDGVDLPAQEMKKWFDRSVAQIAGHPLTIASNYHYLVNELGPSSTFSLVADAEVRTGPISTLLNLAAQAARRVQGGQGGRLRDAPGHPRPRLVPAPRQGGP